MLYDIFINFPRVILFTCFLKNFLVDAQLADIFHYDVTKLN